MVSSALESARSRNLASPAPPHAPSPSTKTTLVATTAAQRIARLQTQIRAMRAEKATMAEELAQIVRGRKLFVARRAVARAGEEARPWSRRSARRVGIGL